MGVWRVRAFILISVATLSGCGGGGSAPAPAPAPIPEAVTGPAWWGFGRDVQHTAQSAVATQPLSRIRWSATVDLAPQLVGSDLLIHYGSPVITAKNTVLIPLKTGAADGFSVEARSGASGALLWSAASDYILPEHGWTPSYNLSLTTNNRLYMPGAGGKVLYRDDADAPAGASGNKVFFGSEIYLASQALFDASVFINTPLSIDSEGNLFFGFVATAANPAGLVSGIARIGADGVGRWVAASAAAADPTISKMAMNSAPALSSDQRIVYVAVNTVATPGIRQSGYLLALDSITLATKAAQRLNDPKTGRPAWINDNASSSPTVGPDGDVYYGVLESNPPGHNYRGWLLHFDGTLAASKLPGSFGWDISASIVPAGMVSAYGGSSAYLIMTKYNNYGDAGTGDGKNRMAVLDPNQSQADFISGNPVMKEILTILGPTPDPGYPGGVTEWCINTAAVDPLTRSILVNSEDGYLYRWDTASNQFTERIRLTGGIGEAYTPTAVGPDGAVYAIQNATLFSVGR
ncbi:MAG: hypothetical protein D4S02_15005 [Rhodocyclaceae bacterium]|nr:MAG: hypothetical protein D4S02_15005 [Rhodocyclaceae bacterium]